MKVFWKNIGNRYLNLNQTKSWFNTYRSSLLLLTIFISLTVMGFRRLGALQALELLAYDWMVNLHDQDKTDSRLLVVEITDRDIKQQKSFPIADGVIAKALNNIQQHQPKAIGFDLYREVAYPPGTAGLRQELQKDNVVVIELIGSGDNSVPAPPSVTPEQIGFNDIVLDEDDVLRRNLMFVQFESSDIPGKIEEMYSFALRLSLKYLAERANFEAEEEYLQIGSAKFPVLQKNSGGYQLHPLETAGWQILIDYQSHNIAKKVTLAQVLADEVPPSLIKDKIVLIGTSAPSIKDIYSTPYKGAKSPMPGVVAHAQMTSQILSVVLDDTALFWFWSEGIEGLWVWGWSLVAVAIAWKLKHPLSIITGGVAGLGSLFVVSLSAFVFTGWIPFFPPAISFAVTLASVLGYQALYSLFYDPLTGLPNRSLFAKKLNELKRKNHKSRGLIGILCLDLDRFKLINDGLGYQAGDRILIETTQRLQANLGAKAILARVGADEFAIAIKTGSDTMEAIKLANRLDKTLAVPYELSQQNIFTSARIGLAFNRLGAGFQPEELLQAAHTAMYQAKVSGKSRHEVFATKMHEQALQRLQLEADLNQAIDRQEFELFYQPIVCLKTGQLSGFEALVRWQSPTRGFISPGAFIPIAEETGLIVAMGEWILTTACEQMQQWRKLYPSAESVIMSVNLSSRQFAQVDLIAQIQETLITTGLDGANLKLEITESMVMDDVENTIELLHELKKLGIKISMDDFGTGFSSFSYLHRFPTDTLKIDRSFVSNMSQGLKNQDIVNSIVILAHRLGMDVIAEGIETPEEQSILEQFNCEYGQGYWFAKPLPKEDATELFEQHKIWEVQQATLPSIGIN